MASLTVENYLKAIYCLAENAPKPCVATGRIAESLGVLPGTVTSMLKTLADGQLVHYRPYEGVELTEAGESLALRVIRRHRLIELFLVRTLDLSWDEVHEEAEHMEHAVSDWLVDRMDQHLGHPKFDPHGDPIPAANGSLVAPIAIPLSQCQAGQAFRVVRVLDQSSEFLRNLSRAGIEIGLTGSVTEIHPEGGPTVLLAGQSLQVAPDVAAQLAVATSEHRS